MVAERGRLMQQACEQTTGGMAAIVGEERAKVAAMRSVVIIIFAHPFSSFPRRRESRGECRTGSRIKSGMTGVLQ